MRGRGRKSAAPPLRFLGLFVLLSGLPLAALGWLGWHMLEQDRALDAQRVRERLESAASVLTRELDRSTADWEQRPIILLTAKTQEAEKVLGIELGADDYVTKPYSARELRARVKAHLRRGASRTPEIASFGDFELDFARCELRRAGNP